MKLFLDITRIAYRLTGTTPTGIDRVEFAYANRILRDEAYRDCICVFTAPFFTGALRRDLMLDVLDRIGKAWRIDLSADADPIYGALNTYLRSPISSAELARRRFRNVDRIKHLRSNMVYPIRDLARSPVRLDRWLKRTAANQPIYLNTSHNQLETPARFAWAANGSIRNVFFVHDTIPIAYPEFVAAVSPARHERRMRTVAQMASLVVVNSTTTQQHLASHFEAAGLRLPPVAVIPLGVAPAFIRERDRIAAHTAPAVRTSGEGHPYFVTLSTIEPRKNLLFLFAVWRRLIERHGSHTPRLVVAGQRGWENENIADILERSRVLGPYLVEVSDLCDDALARLLSGAVGLLQPSSIEGFGLPLIEGLTVGTPVVASDIAAHREAAGGFGDFIDPLDGRGWIEAIEALADPNSLAAQSRRATNIEYRPLTWVQHVDRAIASIGEHVGPKTLSVDP